MIITDLIAPAYVSDTLLSYWNTLQDNQQEFTAFLDELTNHTLIKNNFWTRMQQFISHYRSSQKDSDIEKDIDEFMSSINDEKDIDVNKIPESIKYESRMMENLLNFYISLM